MKTREERIRNLCARIAEEEDRLAFMQLLGLLESLLDDAPAAPDLVFIAPREQAS